MPDPSTAGPARVTTTQKIRVFISYARTDMGFADAIVEVLEKHDIEVLIDRRDLPYGEEWKPELLDFVRRSDAVVFIVSPRSIASRWCGWEVEQVKAESKRLVPIVLEQVPTADLPSEIADVHLLPFTDTWNPARGPGEAFLAQVRTLVKVLLTNRSWIKDHTHLGELARRWDGTRAKDGAARAEVLLLRGDALAEAELWVSNRPREGPEPTDLHRAFLQESRKTEQARFEREREELNKREQRISLRTQQLVGAEARRAREAHRHPSAMRLVLAGEPSDAERARGIMPDPTRRAELAAAAMARQSG